MVMRLFIAYNLIEAQRLPAAMASVFPWFSRLLDCLAKMGLGSTNFPKKRDEWRNGRDEWLFLGMILIPDLETGSPKIAIHGILSLNSLTWEKSRFYLVLQEQKIHRRLDRIIFQTGDVLLMGLLR